MPGTDPAPPATALAPPAAAPARGTTDPAPPATAPVQPGAELAGRRLPSSLRWAVGILRGEVVALALLAVGMTYQALAAGHDLPVALLLIALTVGLAALLATLARALYRRRSAARGATVVLQLMMLPVGYYMMVGGLSWAGAIVAVLGLAVCALLVSPATTTALGLDDDKR